MNRIFLIGNLTRDPELSETQSGIAVCRFSIAVNRRRTTEGEQQTDFFNVTAWRGLAENVAKFCQRVTKLPWSAICRSGNMRTGTDKSGQAWT